MSTLIILRGNSGSGKSSVAKMLQRKIGRNTLMIPQDIVRREMLYALDGKDTAALPLLIDLITYGHSRCEYVILEGILNADWYEPLFTAAQKLFGNRIFAYYYDIPFDETVKRHKTRAKSSEFGETEMRGWWKEKDFISIIPETVLNKDITLESAVNMIFQDITK